MVTMGGLRTSATRTAGFVASRAANISGTYSMASPSKTTARPQVHTGTTTFSSFTRRTLSARKPMGNATPSWTRPREDSTAPTNLFPSSADEPGLSSQEKNIRPARNCATAPGNMLAGDARNMSCRSSACLDGSFHLPRLRCFQTNPSQLRAGLPACDCGFNLRQILRRSVLPTDVQQQGVKESARRDASHAHSEEKGNIRIQNVLAVGFRMVRASELLMNLHLHGKQIPRCQACFPAAVLGGYFLHSGAIFCPWLAC